MSRVRDFRERFPHVNLVIGLGDNPVDLIHEGIDCAIRVGELGDSSFASSGAGLVICWHAPQPARITYSAPGSHNESRSLKNILQCNTFRTVPERFRTSNSTSTVLR
jgi:LysR family transcriptional regulator for bpeEF and oprC